MRNSGPTRVYPPLQTCGAKHWRVFAPPDPSRKPSPRPGLRRMLLPLGPVAVFGASNFPLAYSTMGTDAASALAAGCPVIVKGHPLHPGTGEIAAQVVAEAVRASPFPNGWFSFLHAGGDRERDIGSELLEHPCVREPYSQLEQEGFEVTVAPVDEFGEGDYGSGEHEPPPPGAYSGSRDPVVDAADGAWDSGEEPEGYRDADPTPPPAPTGDYVEQEGYRDPDTSRFPEGLRGLGPASSVEDEVREDLPDH